MKIQYASDIHLELSDNSRFINSMPFEVTGDVLVFAGDIGYLRDKTLPNMNFGNGYRQTIWRCCCCPVITSSMVMAMY